MVVFADGAPVRRSARGAGPRQSVLSARPLSGNRQRALPRVQAEPGQPEAVSAADELPRAAPTARHERRAAARRRAASDLVPPVDLVWEYRPQGAIRTSGSGSTCSPTSPSRFTRDGYIDVEGPQAIEPSIDPLLKALDCRAALLAAGPAGREQLLGGPRAAARVLRAERRGRGEPADRDRADARHRATAAADQRSTCRSGRCEPGSLEAREPRRQRRRRERLDAAWTIFYASANDTSPLPARRRGRTHHVRRRRPRRDSHRRARTIVARRVAPRRRRGRQRRRGRARSGRMITQVAGIEKVTNLRAAAGGSGRRDDRGVPQAARPASCGGAGRAVTESDFETFATAIDGVQQGARARRPPPRLPRRRGARRASRS